MVVSCQSSSHCFAALFFPPPVLLTKRQQRRDSFWHLNSTAAPASVFLTISLFALFSFFSSIPISYCSLSLSLPSQPFLYSLLMASVSGIPGALAVWLPPLSLSPGSQRV